MNSLLWHRRLYGNPNELFVAGQGRDSRERVRLYFLGHFGPNARKVRASLFFKTMFLLTLVSANQFPKSRPAEQGPARIWAGFRRLARPAALQRLPVVPHQTASGALRIVPPRLINGNRARLWSVGQAEEISWMACQRCAQRQGVTQSSVKNCWRRAGKLGGLEQQLN